MMADSLSHSCPTGDSGVMPCCGRTPFEVSRDDRMTLDESLVTCYGGYPKAAVERAAKVIADFFDNWCDDAPYWPTDDLMIYNHDIRKDALAAIRAFHNEGSE